LKRHERKKAERESSASWPSDDPSVTKGSFQNFVAALFAQSRPPVNFGKSQNVDPLGWVPGATPQIPRSTRRCFSCKPWGIPCFLKSRSGDYLIMRRDPLGTRQGKIVVGGIQWARPIRKPAGATRQKNILS